MLALSNRKKRLFGSSKRLRQKLFPKSVRYGFDKTSLNKNLTELYLTSTWYLVGDSFFSGLCLVTILTKGKGHKGHVRKKVLFSWLNYGNQKLFSIQVRWIRPSNGPFFSLRMIKSSLSRILRKTVGSWWRYLFSIYIFNFGSIWSSRRTFKTW